MLFHLYHPRLVSIIKVLMRGEGAAEQAEEIAAAVWSSLCGEAYGRLREHDERGGPLLVYLAGMARNEIWKRRRSERNRHSRERMAARTEANWDHSERRLVMQEFLATLTPREREFFLSNLLDPSDSGIQSAASTANGWKLRSRILKKLRKHLFGTK
jgi:hypothetical protein